MSSGRILLASLAFGLASCASVDKVAPVETRTAAAPLASLPASSDDLLAYAASLRGLNESALAAEAARQRREPGDMARVKAALALSLSPQADESEIVALVEPVEKNEGARQDAKAMAGFLHSIAVERRGLKESATARVRDERRTADAQKQRADSLQQKLDALTELEKSLSDRQVPNR